MDPTWLVLLALALGLVVGAGLVALLSVAAQHGERAREAIDPAVPDGVDQVLDALESAGIVVDPSNNVVKASPGAYALGLVRDGALAGDELSGPIDRVRRDGEPITSDIEIVRGRRADDGVQLHLRVARLGARHILILADDHTEQLRLDAVRRDFIANISHELKTPIGAVSLLAEALRSAADDPDAVAAFATQLTGESARLARITHDIIELSRLQAADTVPNLQPLSIDDVIAAAVDQNRVAAAAGGIQLVVGDPAEAQVVGNEALLVTAVHNLISNAIQYSPDRSRIGIGVRTVRGTVEVTVTDQGEGIPAADLDRVFERFYRVDQARSRATGGTGLGLAIVKHAVQNHGGDVTAWSKPGRGSTFTIRLPEITAPSAAGGASEEESA